jgi:ribonucleoside-diphosphate reductase alpha chain
MQQAPILKYIVDNFTDPIIKREAKKKLRFIPLNSLKKASYESLVKHATVETQEVLQAKALLATKGEYEVVSPQFLSGANISVGITEGFMQAVKSDGD